MDGNKDINRNEKNRPRKLTSAEITEILDILPNIKSAANTVSDFNTKVFKKIFREQLKDIEITPLGIKDLKDEILRQFIDTQIRAGDMVGVKAGAAIIKPITQLALNSFSTSGSSKNISAGVERITELINASQITKKPSCTVYFKDEFLSFEDIIIKKRPDFTEITVKDLVIGTPDIDNTDIDMEEPEWYDLYRLVYRSDFDRSVSKDVLKLVLDPNLLYAYKITMIDIVNLIEKDQPVICVFSPMSIAQIHIYPIEKEITSKLSNMEIISVDQASLIFLSMIVIPALDQLKVSGISGIKQIYPVEAPVLQIVKEEYPIDDTPNGWFLILNEMRMKITGITNKKIIKLCEVVGMKIIKVRQDYIAVESDISPTKRIREAILEGERDEKAYEKRKREEGARIIRRPPTQLSIHSKLIYADTTGTNLNALLSHPQVDSRRTFCNDVHEIRAALGIEAARTFLIKEFVDIISAESYIDPRHLVLLVDYMTNLGKVYGVTSGGASKQDIGTLENASYENAMKHFQQASGFGEKNPVTGTSASIFIGQRALIGTKFNPEFIRPENLALYEETRKKLLEMDNLTLDVNTFNDVIENLNLDTGGDIAILEGMEEEMFAQTLAKGAVGVEREPLISDRPNKFEIAPIKTKKTESKISENTINKDKPLMKAQPLVSQELENIADEMFSVEIETKCESNTMQIQSGTETITKIPIPSTSILQTTLPMPKLEVMPKAKGSVKIFDLEEFLK